ncbi:hypothetical protein ABZU86_12035 [Streptomyces sp. NPDC005271]|uniref:hypothetical protein n=1 Tax=unclassified Streptomyces TaxID=2593676 RepID=UPI0033A7FE66
MPEVTGAEWGTVLDIVVDRYESDRLLDLAHMRAQVGMVAGLLKRGGFGRLPSPPADVGALRSRELRELIGGLRLPSGTERLLLYWAGHGWTDRPRGLFLLCSDTPYSSEHDSAISQTNAIAPAVLGERLALCGARDIVLIMDACGAGGGAEDAVVAFRNAAAGRRTTDPPRLVVMGSAAPERVAEERTFSEALRSLLADEDEKVAAHRGWGPHDRWITVEELTKALEARLGASQPPDVMTTGVISTPFFPNPLYDPQAPDHDLERRRTVPALKPKDVREHFMLKFRGIDTADDSGYFFQGRVRPLRSIVTWLRTEGSGMFVVTGPPGSGKSALLGRIAVLSDAYHRKAIDACDAHAIRAADPMTLPEVGDINVGIHARGKGVLECVEELTDTLKLRHPRGGWRDPEQLLAAIGRTDVKLTVLLDALDEALPGEAGVIAERLLRPLADQPGVKVLVGTRPRAVGADSSTRSLLSALAPEPGRLVHLDQDADVSRDIEAYAHKRLTDLEGSPYSLGDDELVRRAARRVARESESVFLMARLFTRALARRDDLLDMDSPEAGDIFRSRDVAEVFAADLARYGGRERKVRDLLMPLAWAQGAGLPKRTVWAAAATALNGGKRTYTTEDLAWVMAEAGAHLIETGEDGQSVYRLYHQAYADHLRETATGADRAPALLYEAVLETVPCRADGRRDWARANPYVLSHLPAYAVAAGRLDHLVQESGILTHADPIRLLRVLNNPAQQRLPLPRLYLRVWDELRGLSSPGDRAAVLQIRAGIDEPDALPQLKTDSQLGWRVLWGNGRRTNFHGVLADGPTSSVGSVAIDIDPDGSLTVAAGTDDGRVYLWDGGSGELLHRLSTGRYPVGSVELARTDGRLLLAVTSEREVRLWDCANGRPMPTPCRHRRKVTAMAFTATAEGGLLLATGSGDGRIHLWDAERGTSLRTWPSRSRRTRALALADMPGSGGLLIGVDAAGRVSVWKLGRSARASATPVWWRSGRRMLRAAHGIAVSEIGGRPVVVGRRRGKSGTVRYLDLATGKLTEEDMVDDASAAEAVGWVKDDPTAYVTGGKEGRVDLRRGSICAGRWTGHSAHVRAVAGARNPSGDILAVSGSKDGTVRLWNTAVSAETELEARDEHHDDHVTKAALASLPSGRVLLATGSAKGTVRIWDGTTGRRTARRTAKWAYRTYVAPNDMSPPTVYTRREVLSGHEQRVVGVRWAPATDGDRMRLISGSRSSTIQIWSDSGHPLLRLNSSWVAPLEFSVTALATTGPGPGACHGLTAIGRTNGTIALCTGMGHTLPTQPALRMRLLGHRRSVRAVAFLRLTDGTLWLASADEGGRIKLWECPSGKHIGELRGPGDTGKAHQGPVHSLTAVRGIEGPLLISAGDDAVRVWDLTSRTARADLGCGPAKEIAALTTADERVLVAAATPDRSVDVWDAHAAERLTVVRGFPHEVSTVSMIRDPNGSAQALLAVGAGPTVHVVELLQSTNAPRREGT